jgi:hypothetical protein
MAKLSERLFNLANKRTEKLENSIKAGLITPQDAEAQREDIATMLKAAMSLSPTSQLRAEVYKGLSLSITKLMQRPKILSAMRESGIKHQPTDNRTLEQAMAEAAYLAFLENVK